MLLSCGKDDLGSNPFKGLVVCPQPMLGKSIVIPKIFSFHFLMIFYVLRSAEAELTIILIVDLCV